MTILDTLNNFRAEFSIAAEVTGKRLNYVPGDLAKIDHAYDPLFEEMATAIHERFPKIWELALEYHNGNVRMTVVDLVTPRSNYKFSSKLELAIDGDLAERLVEGLYNSETWDHDNHNMSPDHL